jgi:fructose-1,6-bisphosphatase/inositol monophosphatase family enzyme
MKKNFLACSSGVIAFVVVPDFAIMADYSYDDILSLSLEMAKEAGALLQNAWDNREFIIEHKGKVDLVTETDKQIEDFLMQKIKSKYPNHRFVGEETFHLEGGYNFTDEPTWIIDPIDGTTNFVHK